MDTPNSSTQNLGAGDRDLAWREGVGRVEEGDDESRTMAYAGFLPRNVDRDGAHFVVIEARDGVGEQRIEIGEVPVIVGRSSKCDVVIADGRVSGRHLQLRLAGDRLIAEDLNSSNGTFLDGHRIAGPAEFPVEAALQMGQQVLRHEYRSRTEVARVAHLSADLQKACSFIQALLPKPLAEGPERSGWHLAPCATLGGDAFGYHYLDAHRLAIYLLDVCGHGAGAAMLSVSAMNAVRRQSLPRVDFADPSQVLGELNEIFQMDDHDGMYFSIWYGVYDRRTRRLSYSSAGHPPALLRGGADGGARRLATKALAVGLMPTGDFPRDEAPVAPGDRLYLFSDGAYEIVTKTGDEWSLDQFEQEIHADRAPVEREADRLFARVRELSIKDDLDDDFSLVVLEFHD
jgi:serine phosphatase RsbU (regulator of sigma subunit)